MRSHLKREAETPPLNWSELRMNLETSCFDFRLNRKRSRREILRIGSAGLLGLTLPQLLAAQEQPAAKQGPSFGRAKACILLFMWGGPAQQDTWDMKPDAPREFRGEFQPIATKVPGIQICEHLPKMARVMHHCAIIRSMHHGNRLHDSASTEVFTGRPGLQGDREEFAPIPQFFPSHGAVVSHFRPNSRAPVNHAALPWLIHNVVTTPCQGGGFMGPQFDPFEIQADLSTLNYQVEILKQLDQLSASRISKRSNLLDKLDQHGLLTRAAHGDLMWDYRQRAIELLGSVELQKALRIEEESDATRQRYGLKAPVAQAGDGAAAGAAGRELRGQNLLLARRMVEAGVPFVNVNDFRQQGQNWDSHADNFGQHKKYLLPQADQALAALIEDLDERGLLASTLVVATGEFGRTPTINGTAGRDHWPDCYSVVLAGGGIRGGQVFGSSDRIGAYPETNPVTPADLAATIFDRFGVDPTAEIFDTTRRPHRASTGEPIRLLFG